MNYTKVAQFVVGLVVLLVAFDTVPTVAGWLLLLLTIGLLVVHSRSIPR